MARRIYKLAAVLLVMGALVGGAYGVARHAGGDAGYQPEVAVAQPALPVVLGAHVVVVTPAAQPLPTAEPSLETAVVEESAAAPEVIDNGPLVLAPDVSAPPSPPPPPPPAIVDPAVLAADTLAAINAQRAAAGWTLLQLDPGLVVVAGERVEDMVQKGYFSHTSPTGETFVTLMDRHGVPHSVCGENIAYNNYPDNETVAVAVSTWMASPGHRDNMLNPYFTRVGIGVARDGAGMKYYTVVFAES
jgi:uncharacterized protein YkwD